MFQHDLAGCFGLGERLEGRATNFDGGPVLMNGTPGGYETGLSMKAGTAAGLEADNERKAVAVRVPDLHVLDRIFEAAELHAAP
ncbi:MAG: hypothetical protein JO283_12795 [Bradyrhizobium sp.]|nr:hypothetical protein [Bradyrhizobium sp.]